MDELRAEVIIELPADEIFEYLVDVANHPEFCDHFLVDWHLTREDTRGVGAGARFRVRGRDRFAWADLVIVEAEEPRVLVARGRGGRFNRVRTVYRWELTPSASGSTTSVAITVQRDAQAAWDRARDVFGGRLADQRRWRRALGRLEAILERGEQRGERATLSGGPRKPATGSPLR